MPRKNSNQRSPEPEIKNLVAARIRTKMDELLKEVKERHRIEKECVDSLREEGRATIITLDDLTKWTLGVDPIIEKRRLELEERLCRIRKETREQKVNFWRDVQTLRRDIRDIRDLFEAVRGAEQQAKNNSSKKNSRSLK
ncbi:MAG: hypothetical protein ABII79_05570 [bacterium]